MTDQKTTLAQRQQVWIDMSRTACDQMCSEQQLLSRDSQGQPNKCYNDAVRMYEYVQSQGYWLEKYINYLEELRVAHVVVSADTFLRGRKQGLVAASPGHSYLADFLEFNRSEAWTTFNKLVPAVEKFRAMLDSALKEDVFSFEENGSLATTALSNLRKTFDNDD